MKHLLEQELETLEGFEAWLDKQEGSQVVGQAKTACDCPLAQWLTSFSQSRIEVGSNGIAVDDGRLPHSQLTWQFIRWIDAWRPNRESITAAQAKQALLSARRSIEPERY